MTCDRIVESQSPYFCATDYPLMGRQGPRARNSASSSPAPSSTSTKNARSWSIKSSLTSADSAVSAESPSPKWTCAGNSPTKTSLWGKSFEPAWRKLTATDLTSSASLAIALATYHNSTKSTATHSCSNATRGLNRSWPRGQVSSTSNSAMPLSTIQTLPVTRLPSSSVAPRTQTPPPQSSNASARSNTASAKLASIPLSSANPVPSPS